MVIKRHPEAAQVQRTCWRRCES